MHLDPYLEHIPEIERRIEAMKPDAVVIGLGPTGYLMPWIRQRLLRDVRTFGVNDVFRIMPVDDLVIMDPPVRALDPTTDRFKHILASRPKRWWIYGPSWNDPRREAEMGKMFWHRQLPACVRDNVTPQEWRVWQPGEYPVKSGATGEEPDKYGFRISSTPPETTVMSPLGTITLAWMLGCRRIGVVGLDAIMADHPSAQFVGVANAFCRSIAKEARELGGLVCNLSPISSVTKLPTPYAYS
jgi:hypothetical protein